MTAICNRRRRRVTVVCFFSAVALASGPGWEHRGGVYPAIGPAAPAYAQSGKGYRPDPPDRGNGHRTERGAERRVDGSSPRGPNDRADVFAEPEYRSSIDRFDREPREPGPDSRHPASPIAPQLPPGVKRRDPI